MKNVFEYLDKNRQQFETDLTELLRIPSISADSQYEGEVRRAANWMVEHLQGMGLPAELHETAGHPVVYAETDPVPGAPVVLVYGHYDVQPPDPLDLWTTPPFEPDVREGKIYARGATDDKGQMLTHVKSVQSWLAVNQKLPVQVKFLIEGEEEVGSSNLEGFLDDNRDKLACDCVVISDTSQFAPGVPAITYGLRGIAYYEIHLTGPNRDLHSGVFGGAVTNPANVLSKILASFLDEEGKIQVPGFYDDVIPLSEQELNEFASLPFDENDFRSQLEVDGTIGEVGYSTIERRWSRPSFDVHGIWGGYQGEGEKTVLPAKAAAKFSFRLVPKQDPEKITVELRKFLQQQIPPGIEMELFESHRAPGVVFSLDSPYLQAAADAIETGFGNRPVFIREGGSIPIVSTFAEKLKADVLLLGWGQNDDNLHSPNERFSLADYHHGIRASAALWDSIATIHKNS